MKPKPFLLVALLAMACAAGFVPASGQAGKDDSLDLVLIGELAQQQAALAENQTAIETKLAVIAENVRLARIFVGRGGGSPQPK